MTTKTTSHPHPHHHPPPLTATITTTIIANTLSFLYNVQLLSSTFT